MSEIKFLCRHCGQTIACDGTAAGTTFACPACSQGLVVPALSSEVRKLERRDIFLSYRREGGEHLARLVMKGLVQRGFSVFMDTESLKQGKFDVAILTHIEQATDVVVICSRGALDRCRNEDDWVRQEIKHALAHKKNIVRLMDRNFQMPRKESLPTDIAELADSPEVAQASGFFDATIERLASEFLESEADPELRQIDERSEEARRLAWARLRALVAGVAAGILLLVALVSVPAAWNVRFNTQFHRLGRISKETVCVGIACNLIILAGARLSYAVNRLGPWLVFGGSVAMAVANLVLCYYFLKAVKPLHDYAHANNTLDYFRWSVEIVPYMALAYLYRKGK